MTIKDDYINFLLENNDILKTLEDESTITFDLFEPVIKVLNHLADSDLKVEGENDKDVLDVFSIGFHYLYSSLDHIKRILSENFDDELDDLLELDYNLYLYLRVDELDTLLDGSNPLLQGLLDQLNTTFEYRKTFNDSTIDQVESELANIQKNLDDDQTPVSDMFMDFADSLGIELI